MKSLWLVVLAAATAAQAEDKTPDNAVVRGVQRAGNAIERGIHAAGRGVEHGAKAVQKRGKKVSDKAEEKITPKK